MPALLRVPLRPYCTLAGNTGLNVPRPSLLSRVRQLHQSTARRADGSPRLVHKPFAYPQPGVMPRPKAPDAPDVHDEQGPMETSATWPVNRLLAYLSAPTRLIFNRPPETEPDGLYARPQQPPPPPADASGMMAPSLFLHWQRRAIESSGFRSLVLRRRMPRPPSPASSVLYLCTSRVGRSMILQAFRNNSISLKALYLPLAINFGVFVAWQWSSLYDPEAFAFMQTYFTTSLEHLKDGHYVGILTSVFSHSELGHFLANTLMYVSFAPMLLEIIGTRAFAGLYIFGALGGSAAFFLWSSVPGRRPDDGNPTHGASGALYGMIAALAVLRPNLEAHLFYIMRLPLPVFPLCLLLTDAFEMVNEKVAAGEGALAPRSNHAAHLGGLLAGVLYALLLRRRGAALRPLSLHTRGRLGWPGWFS